MNDYLRFVLRGAATSAIVDFSAIFYFWGVFSLAIFFHPLSLVYLVVPGAIVGSVLCYIVGKTSETVSPAWRFALGTGIVAVFAFGFAAYQITTSAALANAYTIDIEWVSVVRLLINAAGVGGLSGLACPASREQITQESKLTYRERLKLYEAAEREAKEARERIALACGGRNQS